MGLQIEKNQVIICEVVFRDSINIIRVFNMCFTPLDLALNRILIIIFSQVKYFDITRKTPCSGGFYGTSLKKLSLLCLQQRLLAEVSNYKFLWRSFVYCEQKTMKHTDAPNYTQHRCEYEKCTNIHLFIIKCQIFIFFQINALWCFS